MTESPLIQAPTGEVIDGRRLLARSVGFGRALRAAGLQVDLGAAMDFAPGAEPHRVGRRDQVDAGEAVWSTARRSRGLRSRLLAVLAAARASSPPAAGRP
ncbi:MAG: hypothetical protein U0838_14570 [Chloroflexota bacterium]